MSSNHETPSDRLPGFRTEQFPIPKRLYPRHTRNAAALGVSPLSTYARIFPENLFGQFLCDTAPSSRWLAESAYPRMFHRPPRRADKGLTMLGAWFKLGERTWGLIQSVYTRASSWRERTYLIAM